MQAGSAVARSGSPWEAVDECLCCPGLGCHLCRLGATVCPRIHQGWLDMWASAGDREDGGSWDQDGFRHSWTQGPRGGLLTWLLCLPPMLPSVLAPFQAGPSTEAWLALAAQALWLQVLRSQKDSRLLRQCVHGNSGMVVIGLFGSCAHLTPSWLPPITVARVSCSVIGQVCSHGCCGNLGKAVIGPFGSCAHPEPSHGGQSVLLCHWPGLLTWPLWPGSGSAHPDPGERLVPLRGGPGCPAFPLSWGPLALAWWGPASLPCRGPLLPLQGWAPGVDAATDCADPSVMEAAAV